MRAGTLKDRVTIEQAVQTQNEYGEAVTSWSTYAERWAEVTSITGREFFQSGQVNTTVTTKFRMRSMDGVTTAMRINFDGDLYNIVAVIDSDWKADLLLLAEKVART